MKQIMLLYALTIMLVACNQKKKKETKKAVVNYPESLAKVIEKHGGIKSWKAAKTLSYKINAEEHTVDLSSRKTVINTNMYALGYDGKDVWLHQQDSTAFKGNPEFYYNLYFYFYAMPFVLADDGIIYEDMKPLEFEGVRYPGIKISYKENVGTSPDDNYFIFYHPKTYQMTWLGYTVTYFSKKPSEKFNIIRYHDWENVNGLLLPKAISWYKKDEKGNPLEPAKEPIQFEDALVSQAALADSFFEKPKQ